MKLFFETANQSQVFLWLCSLGFLCALACDLLRGALHACAAPLCDVLAALLYGAALLSALLLFPGEGPRVYHAFSLLAGTLLYHCGLRRLSDWLWGLCRARRKKTKANSPKVLQNNESMVKSKVQEPSSRGIAP